MDGFGAPMRPSFHLVRGSPQHFRESRTVWGLLPAEALVDLNAFLVGYHRWPESGVNQANPTRNNTSLSRVLWDQLRRRSQSAGNGAWGVQGDVATAAKYFVAISYVIYRKISLTKQKMKC